ncbi:DUF2971 domain-containing protein [Clostridium butyricum]|uniref:DUF2971 domain-containing protein n=1 Tax=Clostridium butyricum TaxID=1492 RepID=UPI00374EFA3A
MRKRILKYIDYGQDGNEKFLRCYVPQKLYKYRSLNEYTLESLKESYVYASSPLDFNDIFDCRDNIDYRDIEINKNKVLSEVSHLSSEKYKKYLLAKTIHGFEYITNICRIACFSETNKSNLMWSHYSENHTGICIEYDYNTKNETIINHIFPVKYSKKPINTMELKNPDVNNYNYECELDILISAITKSKEWEYEKEWRFIIASTIFDKDREGAKFLTPIPNSILLGSRFFDILNYINDSDKLLNRLNLTISLMEFVLKNNIKLEILLPKIGTYTLYEESLDSERIYEILKGDNEHINIITLSEYIDRLKLKSYK